MQVNAFLIWFVWIIIKIKNIKKFGLLKFYSGYWKFYLNSPKGYSRKKKLTRRLHRSSKPFWFLVHRKKFLFVSESDILGPNGNLSNVKNLLSFERETLEDSSYKYRIQKFLLFMSISPLWKTCLKHHKRCTCQLYGNNSLINKLVVILIR